MVVRVWENNRNVLWSFGKKLGSSNPHSANPIINIQRQATLSRPDHLESGVSRARKESVAQGRTAILPRWCRVF